MPRYGLSVKNAQDSEKVFDLSEEYGLEILEVADFYFRFSKPDLAFLHKLLKRLAIRHCLIQCY